MSKPIERAGYSLHYGEVGVIAIALLFLFGFLWLAFSDAPLKGLDKFDAAANRDFSLLLLTLALLGKMELFLWMAGIGIHFFWLAMLASQLQPVRNRPA